MTRILAFIVASMGFIWSGAKFKITGSEVGASNGGDAVLLAESFARFLDENLEEVERRFSEENWPQTRSELRTLMARRSRDLLPDATRHDCGTTTVWNTG